MRIRQFLLLFFSLALVNCSLFGRKEQPGAAGVAQPETRDVPFEAREAEGPLRHRILVLPFIDDKKDHAPQVIEEARRTVIRELGRTGHFVIVNPEDFPHDTKKFLTPEGEYDLVQVSRLAASMGVAAVVEGKILDLRARRIGDQVGLVRQIRARVDADVRIRMAAGKNGKEILNEVRSGTVESATTRVAERSYSDRFLEQDPELVKQGVRKAVMGSVPMMVKAVEKLSWEGRVAMISGERVFVNAGRLSGLQIGDILKITEDGEEVYDPENGRFIGKAPGRMKGTIEVVSYFGKDGTIAVVHSGSGFKENDRVELY